jgi:hypothetical protein
MTTDAVLAKDDDSNKVEDQQPLPLSKESFEDDQDPIDQTRSDEHSTLLSSSSTSTTSPPLRSSPYRYPHNQAWVSLSALVVEQRSDGRLMTNLDEDDEIPQTPFDTTTTNNTTANHIRNNIKRRLYLLMEDPSSSNAAFWTNVIVSILIVFSAVMTMVETIPAFRSAESNRVW